jgi:hypothetical protein
VRENIKKLFERVLNARPTGLTLADIEEMFVPAEHRDAAYKAVSQLGYAPTNRYNLRAGHFDAEVNILFDGARWGYPNGAQKFNRRTEAADKLHAWWDWRVALGQEWGLVRAVFNSLHKHCKRADYVRYYWPAIVPLLPDHGEVKQKLTDYKPCSNPTPIPVELRLACRRTQESITKALLLPEGVKDEPVGLVVAGGGGCLPKFARPWLSPSGQVVHVDRF